MTESPISRRESLADTFSVSQDDSGVRTDGVQIEETPGDGVHIEEVTIKELPGDGVQIEEVIIEELPSDAVQQPQALNQPVAEATSQTTDDARVADIPPEVQPTEIELPEDKPAATEQAQREEMAKPLESDGDTGNDADFEDSPKLADIGKDNAMEGPKKVSRGCSVKEKGTQAEGGEKLGRRRSMRVAAKLKKEE